VRAATDADDLVSEGFARMLSILQRGLGPHDDFRPYLVRTIRNIAYDRFRSDRHLDFTDEIELLDDATPFHDTVIEGVERGLISAAFQTLPRRWQEVLWLTCVQGHSVEQAAGLMGINQNAVTSLAYRAREGLRRAYLQANLPTHTAPRCAPFSAKLGALLRGALGPALRLRVEQHVAGCGTCNRHLGELNEVNQTLRDQLIEVPRPAQAAQVCPLPTQSTPDITVAGESYVWSAARVA
jgi:RNA polymerase sigma factor (sigma-70 family)